MATANPLSILSSLAVAWALVWLPSVAAAQATAVAEFVLPEESERPVLVLRETPTELVGAPTRELRVFPDGRCELDVPRPMRHAGEHEWEIPRAEVQGLVTQAFAADVDAIDPAQLRASLRSARSADDSLGQTYRFDDGVVEFELNVERQRRGRAAAWAPVARRVRLSGLRADRARHPADERVGRLSALRDALDAVAERYLDESDESAGSAGSEPAP